MGMELAFSIPCQVLVNLRERNLSGNQSAITVSPSQLMYETEMRGENHVPNQSLN